jgi:uncharacterized membrane protein YdbT with pleckstrin-like domain
MAKNSKKSFNGQYEDENVLMVFRKHPVVMRKGLIISGIALTLGTIPSFIKPEMSYLIWGLAVSMALAMILFLPTFIMWYFSIYIVTNKRLVQIIQKGFFSKSVVDIGLDQIQIVNYSINGFQESLLGFGLLSIQTYLGELVINDVHHPAEIQSQLLAILRSPDNSRLDHPSKQ